MKRSAIWAAGVVLVLLVVGAGVLAGGAGYAEDNGDNGDNGDENAVAKCSKATLDGTYLFAHDGVVTEGALKGPFAVAGYDVFDGNGKVDTVYSANFSGEITRKKHAPTSTYTVKADCTGTITSTDGSENDLFIAPDGSMFTFVQTDPSTVTSGVELQGTAKRVGD
jgi:hypothetical protein